jgi:hypothetical protein
VQEIWTIQVWWQSIDATVELHVFSACSLFGRDCHRSTHDVLRPSEGTSFYVNNGCFGDITEGSHHGGTWDTICCRFECVA